MLKASWATRDSVSFELKASWATRDSVSFELKGVLPVLTHMKKKGSLKAFSKQFA